MKESNSHPTPTAIDPYGDAGMDNPPRTGAGQGGADDAAGLLHSLTELEQRVEELERGLKVERLALEISGRQYETLEAREQALQKRVEELEELYKLARAEISRLGRQTIDAIAKQNAAEARERVLREALERIARSDINNMATLHPHQCADEARAAFARIDAALSAHKEPDHEGK